jgi:hypothetical protein
LGTVQDLQQLLLTNVVEIRKSKGSLLTGEKKLTIAKNELINRVKEINPGYLEVMEVEANIFVRQDLFKGYLKDGDIYFDIPDWDRFISAVGAFYNVCYAPNCDNEED